MAGYSCKSKDSISATLTFIKGEVKVTNGEVETTAKVGDKVLQGNTVSTGEKSVAILAIDDNSSRIELQSNAKIVVETSTAESKKIFLQKGSAWTSVEKLPKNSKYSLHTPTSVAGVRGTKFYTFSFNGIYGTCFCEGKVEYNAKTSVYHQENSEDYVIFTKGDVSALVTQKELAEAGISDPGHHHSVIDNSPLGKKYSLTKEEEQIFFGLAQKKLAEAANSTEK